MSLSRLCTLCICLSVSSCHTKTNKPLVFLPSLLPYSNYNTVIVLNCTLNKRSWQSGQVVTCYISQTTPEGLGSIQVTIFSWPKRSHPTQQWISLASLWLDILGQILGSSSRVQTKIPARHLFKKKSAVLHLFKCRVKSARLKVWP